MPIIPVNTIGFRGGDAVIPTIVGMAIPGIFELAVVEDIRVTIVCDRDFDAIAARVPACPDERDQPILPSRPPLIIPGTPATVVLSQDRVTVVPAEEPTTLFPAPDTVVPEQDATTVDTRAPTSVSEREQADPVATHRSRDPDDDECC